jgi:uncharacterized hydrophobic protein (TIGR00271 family)
VGINDFIKKAAAVIIKNNENAFPAETGNEPDEEKEKKEKNESGKSKDRNDVKDEDVKGDDAKDEDVQDDEREKRRSKPEKENFRDVFTKLISPEERTVGNLVNPLFWREKTAEFMQIREKQKQDMSVFETLAIGAAPTREYYVLTILSCIIATMGLIQGSAAVIIGAMIVAPLMTPILAFSLGVVWGDLFLIRISVASILKGVFWAILISSAIAYLVPLPKLSPEIMARTTPSLFDVAVAIASGLVGAYGNANKKISNSLVGIAIAVALMPPLCTIGIGIGKMSMEVAGGATLLFLINLICISLSGAVVFWIMKVQPASAEQSEVTRRAMSQIVVSVIILALISIPVGLFMIDGYRKETALGEARNIISTEFPEISIVSSEITGDITGNIIELSLTGVEKPDNVKLIEIIDNMKQKHPYISDVRIRFFLSEYLGR